MLAALINERVFENPADAGRVRADHRIHAFRQRAAHRVQIFDHARARPVDVGAVLENDVDERFAEHRFAADEFHFRRGDEDGGNRIGDLVFDQIGRAAFPIGVDDDLHVAQVRNRIERRVHETINPARDSEDREDEDEKFVPRARFDDRAR